MRQPEIHFKYVNATTIKILTTDEMVKQLISNLFRYKDPTYSTFNRSSWDGYNRLYTKTSGSFPIGLWYDAYTALKSNPSFDAKIFVESKINLYKNVTLDDITEFVDSLTITVCEENGEYRKITPHEHQIQALLEYARHGRYTMESATSSGKSMMAYLIFRYARRVQDLGDILLVAPTKTLVDQMYLNFDEYSHDDKSFNVSDLTQRIYSGKSKDITRPIVISTWQSLHTQPKEYFKNFELLFVDECHTADAKKLTKISNNCVNAINRIGCTGSLKDNEVSKMLVNSLFGYTIEIIDAITLINKGFATPLKIQMITLEYNDSLKEDYYAYINKEKNKYQKEIEFIVQCDERRSWLARFVDELEGNTLVLFDRKDAHLYEDMEVLKTFTEKDVHIISGSVKVKDRNRIKKMLEENNNQVLGATFGTFQLGESVNNLQNLVLAHGTKSNVRTLQSIGRLMRKHSSKKHSNIFDIVDVIDSSTFNYVLTHSAVRLKYYMQEGHEISLSTIEI